MIGERRAYPEPCEACATPVVALPPGEPVRFLTVQMLVAGDDGPMVLGRRDVVDRPVRLATGRSRRDMVFHEVRLTLREHSGLSGGLEVGTEWLPHTAARCAQVRAQGR